MFEKVASLQELEEFWSVDDALRANAILDMKAEIMELERKKIKK